MTPLLANHCKHSAPSNGVLKSGEGGIRTPVDGDRRTGFRIRRIQPLCHLSGGWAAIDAPSGRPVYAVDRGPPTMRRAVVHRSDRRQLVGQASDSVFTPARNAGRTRLHAIIARAAPLRRPYEPSHAGSRPSRCPRAQTRPARGPTPADRAPDDRRSIESHRLGAAAYAQWPA